MSESTTNSSVKLPQPGLSTKAKDLKYWIYEVIRLNELKYSARYNNLVQDEAVAFPFKKRHALDLLHAAAVDYGFPMTCRQLLENHWNTMCRQEREKYLKLIKEGLLVHTPSMEHKIAANKLLQRLLFIMTGRDDMLDLVSMRQFFWMVKQNLAGQCERIDHIMMPVFYGKQETGKSHIILEILKPLKDLSVKADFTIFQDTKNLQALEQLVVIFLDEMGKAKETSIETIKKILSKGTHLQREFFSQEEFNHVSSRTTLIAATNKPISEIIVDDEMRRFWQIEMAEYEWLNHFWDSEIKTMNWRMLWDCVDVDEREPADVVWPLFKKTQSVYARGNHLADFVAERLELNSDEWHDGGKLYSQYIMWADYNNLPKRLTRHNFSARIKDLVVNKTSNGTKWNFSIKPFDDKPKPKLDIERRLLEADGVFIDEQNQSEQFE